LIEEMTGTVVEYSMKTYHSDLPKIEEFVQLNGKTLLELLLNTSTAKIGVIFDRGALIS